LPDAVVILGEVGLGAELRPVFRLEQRLKEAEKLGFSTIFVSKYNKIALKNTGIQIRLVAKIEDVARELFG
jgi:DNA repair protein RadA/Sms